MAVETASEETPMRLEGKTALVTGGASGFGAGIVRKFLAEGARVAIADINADAANDFATGLGENAFAVAVDVSRNDSVEAMAESVLDRFGGLDILVNNAGVTHLPAAMEDISEEDFDRVLAVNTKSVYLTARHFVPVMKQKARGRYSQRRLHGRRQPAAAAELVQRVQGLDDHRDEIDGGGTGARPASASTRINPVAGETPLLKSFMGEDTPEIRAKFLSTIPLGRFSTPEDMGNAACFLCSDEAAMITGVAMEVDGGRCI
jgi:3-oxoacyl-[acyl-carrier protein] reductase